MFEVPLTSKIWQQGTALTPPALPACSQQVLLAVSPPMGFTCGGKPTVPPGASLFQETLYLHAPLRAK